MRWRDQTDWIAPDRRMHEALIPDELAQAVRLWTQARRGPGLVCSRESTVPYALRGLLFCAACGRRMQGAAASGSERLASSTAASWVSRVPYLQTSAMTRAPSTSVKTR